MQGCKRRGGVRRVLEKRGPNDRLKGRLHECRRKSRSGNKVVKSFIPYGKTQLKIAGYLQYGCKSTLKYNANKVRKGEGKGSVRRVLDGRCDSGMPTKVSRRFPVGGANEGWLAAPGVRRALRRRAASCEPKKMRKWPVGVRALAIYTQRRRRSFVAGGGRGHRALSPK